MWPGWWDALAELVLPRSCLGCGRPRELWCATCLAVELQPRLHAPDPCPAGLPGLGTATTYQGAVRAALIAAKERDRRELDPLLGALLGVAIATVAVGLAAPPPFRLVPVPAAPAARRVRGRDHVADWAARAAAVLRRADVPAEVHPVLVRRPGGRDSVGLDAAHRAENLRGAFVWSGAALPSGTVVLLDDLVTTGATLVAAARALPAGAGPEPVAAVVAAAARWSAHPVPHPP